MEKIIPSDSYDYCMKMASLVKFSSRGIFGADKMKLIKEAGEEFVYKAQQLQFKEGEVPVYDIAMGSSDAYGPNRNGDGFRSEILEKRADTFRKYGRHYRHHKNKDPKVSYGVIKRAWFNPVMKRVQLIEALNGNEKAAKANDGLVADKEMDLLERGEDIPTSMSCHVTHDVCSACGNKAKTRKDYCKSAEEGGTCRLFGCATGLTKVADDGHIQHVDNPDPVFFDNSSVFRNADRIAFGAAADFLQKAASCGYVLGGAELAEDMGIVAPLSLLIEHVPERIRPYVKTAYALAGLEDVLSNQLNDQRVKNLARAFDRQIQPSIEFPKTGYSKAAEYLSAATSQKVLLNLDDFAQLILGHQGSEKAAAVAEQAAGMLPGIFNRLISSGTLEYEIQNNPFSTLQKQSSAAQRMWAQKFASTHSLDSQAVSLRCSLSAIRHRPSPTFYSADKTIKSAQVAGAAEQLARHYALYKIAFVCEQQQLTNLTSELVVLHNYVS